MSNSKLKDRHQSGANGLFLFLLCWSPIWISLVLLALGVIGHKPEDGLNYKTVCNDGSTSLSAGSGACAYHGGVQYFVPLEDQSSKMRAMDRVNAEIEADMREKGYID